jgi:hypothetical protein
MHKLYKWIPYLDLVPISKLSHYRAVKIFFPPHGATAPSGPGVPHRGFTITLRHTTLGRTALDKGSAGRRDFCLTTHNTHKKQPYMPPLGFEPAIPATERPQTYALDSAATGIGTGKSVPVWFILFVWPTLQRDTCSSGLLPRHWQFLIVSRAVNKC